MEETSEDDEIARKRARYACTFRPESSVLLYDSMYKVCCVYINVVVVFSSDLGIFQYFNIRILGRYIRTNNKTMLAALYSQLASSPALVPGYSHMHTQLPIPN